MSLDKEEMRLLVETLIGAGLLSAKTAKEARDILHGRFKLKRINILGEKSWKYGPAALSGLALTGALIVLRQIFKDTEENVKEA